MEITYQNPFQKPGNWYKGNLHAHTTMSDGKKTPEEVAIRYEKAGYHFLAITDHNKRTVIPGYQGNILLIPGEEIDITCGGCYHFIAINTKQELGLDPEKRKNMQPQEIITAVRQAGGSVILAHPYWSNETIEMTKLCSGVLGIEVFNHSCYTDWGNGHSMAHWDDMLRLDIKVNGFAVDDAHAYTVRDFQPDDSCGGWIMVKANHCTADEIMTAIRSGDFYAASGPEIHSVTISEEKITVETSPVRSIAFRTPRWGGKRMQNADNKMMTCAEYIPKSSGVRCIRVECTDELGRMAWTNPMWFS